MLPKAVMTPIWAVIQTSANMISVGKTRKTACTYDSAPSHEGPPAVQIPYADGARTVSHLHRVVMKLQLLVCIFTKRSPWIRLCVCHQNYKNMAFPVRTSIHGTAGHLLTGLQGLGHHCHMDPQPRNGMHEDTLSRQKLTHSLKPQKVFGFSWSLHRKQGSFICGFHTVLTLVKFGFSAVASFDSFLGSFILSAQSALMFSTSPLTYLVSTLAVTYLLFLAEQFLSESKSLFHNILEVNPRRCLKGISWKYM